MLQHIQDGKSEWSKTVSKNKAPIASVKQKQEQQGQHKMIKMIFLLKSMIVVASTFLNNCLSELHVKYFSRTCFRLQQSRRICLTVRKDLHSSQSGWLSPVSRCQWVTRVWPMQSLLVSETFIITGMTFVVTRPRGLIKERWFEIDKKRTHKEMQLGAKRYHFLNTM